MKLTEEQMKLIAKDYHTEGFDYELIEKSAWVDEGKMQSREIIFSHNGKYYAFVYSRSGEYWSDYDYYYNDDIIEVTKEAYTAYRWVQVTAKENPPEVISCNPQDVESSSPKSPKEKRPPKGDSPATQCYPNKGETMFPIEQHDKMTQPLSTKIGTPTIINIEISNSDEFSNSEAIKKQFEKMIAQEMVRRGVGFA